jgi:hypothetical protein
MEASGLVPRQGATSGSNEGYGPGATQWVGWGMGRGFECGRQGTRAHCCAGHQATAAAAVQWVHAIAASVAAG